MNIMEMHEGGISTEPHRYFIDIEVDVEMFPPETRRIEIPRRLAIYITNLKEQISSLQKENNELRQK